MGRLASLLEQQPAMPPLAQVSFSGASRPQRSQTVLQSPAVRVSFDTSTRIAPRRSRGPVASAPPLSLTHGPDRLRGAGNFQTL